VLELRPSRSAVVRCYGESRALDAFPSLGAQTGRIAADELWLIAPAPGGADLAARARSYLAGADPEGLVVDHSEAWGTWTLTGDTRGALARVTDFPLPETGFVQGAVAQVPAKLLLERDRVQLVVPIQLSHHIAHRIVEACSDLGANVVEAGGA
jgi:hypothetical protein